MSFSFGSKTPQTPAFGAAQPSGSITFGTPVAQTTPQFGFGSSAPAQTSFTGGGFQLGAAAPQTNLFGAPASSAAPLLNFNTTSTASATKPLSFGTPAAGTSFGFAATSSAPANISFGGAPASTGLSFGAPTAAAAAAPVGLAFGSTATSAANTGLSFGAPAATTTSTGFSIGAPASTGLNFAAPASTGLSFAAPASTGLSFAAPASTGLSFAAPASTALSLGAPASTGLSFATPACTGLTLGAPASTALSFGTPASTGLSLSAPTTTQSGGLFGTAPTTGTGLTFPTLGASATTAAPTLSFGGTTTTAPTLNFATPAATTSTGLSFGLSTPATSSSLFGLGGSILKPTTTTAPLSTTVTTTTQPNVGLGGLAAQQKPPVSAKTEIPPKDQPLPNEILQTVEGFKNFVKEQKSFSSDISMCSIKEFRAVEAEIDAVNKLLKEFEIELQKNRAVAQKLKYDAAKGLQNADIAQRTFNTPPGLQYDNVAPMNFFIDLADGFERKIQEMKLQIENTDSFLKNIRRSSTLTSQDLALGMRRLHETFVALAGRLQSVHNQVEARKEEYLHFRKQILNDDTNVFEKPNSHTEALKLALSSLNTPPPKLASGPTPFNNITATSFAMMDNQNQPPAYPGTTPLTGGLGTTATPTFGSQTAPTGSLFGSSTFGQPSFQFSSPSSSFQLQKPPIGNKRGKQ